MTQATHRETLIATADPSWKRNGWDVHAIPAPDNSACAFIVRDDIGMGREWMFFQGNLIAESQFCSSIRFEMSPDGKMATATPLGQERYASPYAIAVNGRPANETELTTMAEIAWIGPDALAWWGWRNDPHSGREIEGTRSVFLNGADMTGRFAFEKRRLGEKRFILVAADKHCYAIADDGHESCRHPISEWNARLPNNIPWECSDTLGFVRHHLWDDEDGHVMPRVSRGKNHSRIKFRGQLGPPFHEIEGGDSFDFVQSEDGKCLGYIAVRYPAFASLLTGPAYLLSDLGDEIADYEGGTLSKLRNSLATILDGPRRALFSENKAKGTSYFDSLARHYPINGDQMWRQGYHYAKYPFFTPGNSLVVTAWDGANGRFVAIDEKNGPAYDHVKNVRWSPAEKCVCYLAKRGQTFFRVMVK